MRIDGDFNAEYRALEARMKALADAQGDVFLPNPQPQGPVQYVLICMEPSLGRWARSAEEAKSKVEAGFRNFLSSIEAIILHFCVRRYLCRPAESYHITDLSKGAMLVDRAGPARYQRYDAWYPLLQDEIGLVATRTAGIIAVGKVVYRYLERKRFGRPLTHVMHYSGQAARARIAGIEGREDCFEAFRYSVSLEALVATAEEVLRSAAVPVQIHNQTIAQLKASQLTTSRQQLIFNYKVAFESMQSRAERAPFRRRRV